jgi:hypothetical protein
VAASMEASNMEAMPATSAPPWIHTITWGYQDSYHWLCPTQNLSGLLPNLFPQALCTCPHKKKLSVYLVLGHK